MPRPVLPQTTKNSLCTTLPITQPSPAPMSSTQPKSLSQHSLTTDYSELAKAINAIIKSNLLNKTKLHKPNPFDGSSSRKLHMFLLQCRLNFQDWKDLFWDNSTKVNFMLSYPKGPALNFFEPRLLEPNKPAWLSNFDLFISELKANFGSYNPVGEAEAELEGLHIKENHQATKYFIKFMQLASCVQWGKAALLHRTYGGLAKYIKDNMVHHNKPQSLLALWKLAQAIDTRYWEQHTEVSNEAHTSGPSSHSGTSQGEGNTSKMKKSIPDLSSRLGTNGKLTPEERQCHLDNNLCLFCGTSGHIAHDCPKLAASKAHAAKAIKESEHSDS